MSAGTGPRVRIVPLPRETLDALADGDLERARATSPVEITDWLGGAGCRSVWRRRSRQTAVIPADVPWVTGVVRDEVSGRSIRLTAAAGTPERPWP